MKWTSSASCWRIAWTLLLPVALAVSGCVTKRTVREGNRVVQDKYVIRAPFMDAVRSTDDD